MNWNVLIWFGIGVGVYLLFLAVFTIVKKIAYKRRYKKELEEKSNEIEETKDNSSETQI